MKGKPWFSGSAVVCLLLAVVTLAVWWPVIHCEFLTYDDPDYFTANPHVLGGLTWANAVWAFTTGFASNWHPLTWLSLMLDASVFGHGPAGPHVTNLLLHTADTVLLFLLLRRLTAATWRSALVAALFALHPLHVESVAWVAERKDVLSAFFGLLALLAYASFAQKRSQAASGEYGTNGGVPACELRSSSRDYALALLCFALGLMAKPMLVTLPFVMLLLDWWPLNRVAGVPLSLRPGAMGQGRATTRARLILEKIPFFILSAASGVVTFAIQQKGGAVATLTRFTLLERIGNAFVSYARYLGKTFWPTALANPYPHPGHWPPGLVAFAVILFAVIALAAIYWRRKLPFVFVGWFWFVGMLVPVIGLVQVGGQSMADRYTYLPLIGIFIICVWGLAEAQARWPTLARKLACLAAVLLAACALTTRHQIGFWQNDGSLFLHALKTTKNNYVASVNLGTWFSKNGQLKEAMDCYNLALKMSPSDPTVLYDVGNALARIGHWDEAISDYRRALQLGPAHADLLDNLGRALAAKQQNAEAIANFEAALKLDPDSANTHNNLATVLFAEHRFDEAARHYREALRLAPDDARIYANLGDTLVRLGQAPDAAKCYQEALELEPGNTSVQAKLRALTAGSPK